MKSEMVFCRGCGKEIHESALACPKCGAAQKFGSSSQNRGWGNAMAWVIAFAPLIGTFAEGFVSGLFHYNGLWLVMVTIGVNIVLCTKDRETLLKEGVDPEKLTDPWLVPVYLFNRAKVLNENVGYPILWCVLFLLQLGHGV